MRRSPLLSSEEIWERSPEAWLSRVLTVARVSVAVAVASALEEVLEPVEVLEDAVVRPSRIEARKVSPATAGLTAPANWPVRLEAAPGSSEV